MSLSEQFIQCYLDDKNEHDCTTLSYVHRKKEAELLCEKLKLVEEGISGFILTKKQFAHLSLMFKDYSIRGWGLYNIRLFPKSNHVHHIYNYSKSFVYPSRGISQNIPYFRWEFNGLVCRKWVSFNETIACTNCEYVFVNYSTYHNDILLSSYDLVKDKYYETTTHVIGGIVYHEPAAVPYQIQEEDTVVDGVEPIYTKSANKR